jgi:dienelactone hydrolase
MQEVLANAGVAAERFRAAEALIKSDPRADGAKIAAIGYCFGGGVVLAMARQGEPLAVVASFHGMIASEAPMAKGTFAGRIFVATGAADPFVPSEQVEAFKREMDAAGARYEVEVYEGALHGFTNPAATEAGKAGNMPLGYDEAADNASWAKLSSMLSEAFGS